jgi:hypothetical protein
MRLPLLGLALLTSAAIASAAPKGNTMVRQDGQVIRLQNPLCRYDIGLDGTNRYFGPVSGRTNLAVPGQPFMQVGIADKLFPSTRVALAGSTVTVSFGDTGVAAQAKLEAKPDYLALTVTEVTGEGVQWLQVANLHLKITANVGTLVNAAWDDRFAACVLAGNDQVQSFGADDAKAILCARCYPEYGLVGARVAILGLPTGKPEPSAKLLDAIGRAELAEGLPHPLLSGVWIKQSPERFRSYLMCHDLSEANVDDIIRFAKGGFGCIEFYPWHSTASYQLNPGLFPHGLEGLRQVCDKIHAASMQVGLHAMQGMVGWGSKDDPYMVSAGATRKADPRLLQDRHDALAAPLDEKATTVKLQAGAKDWPEQGDLYVEGEIIHYAKRTETAFTEVQRGLYGTTVTPHPTGATVGNLVNCFPVWGNTVYCPDLKTDLPDEICQRLADVFNAVGADMAYFDGGEELLKQPPLWRSLGTFALGVQKRLKKPVILEGNACYSHLSWHVITRGSPHYDPIHFGRREYTLRFKGTNPAGWARNLLTGDVGWFAPHAYSLSADAVTPDEVMLLCLKALGGRSPISFTVGAGALWQNQRMPEMLDIIRACDELKRRDYFTPETLQALTKPRADFDLAQTADREWVLRPMQFGPSRVLNAADPKRASFEYPNPYATQTPFVRLRARSRLAPYGDPANIVLADFAQGNPFKAEAAASADLTQSLDLATEKTPGGGPAVCYRVANRGAKTSAWTKASCVLPAPVDLSQHRRLGLWVKANGSGGILNVQLTGTDARRDHYVPLDFTGWRLLELDTPEDARVWDYSWPYSWTDLFYTDWFVYNATKEVDLYLNGVPAGATAECLIGRLEALQELPGSVKSPALEVGESRLIFPVDLPPEEYLELDFAGRCRHFDPNGKVLGAVKPTGRLALGRGANVVRLVCGADSDSSTRAEVTLAVRGKPLADARRPSLKGQSPRYATLAAEAAPKR